MCNFEDLHENHRKSYDFSLKFLSVISGTPIFNEVTKFDIFKRVLLIVTFQVYIYWTVLDLYQVESLEKRLSAVSILTATCQLLPKLITVYKNRHIFADLIISVDEMWPRTANMNPEYDAQFRKTMKQCRKIFTGVLSFTVIQVVSVELHGLFRPFINKYFDPNAKYTLDTEHCHSIETDSLVVFLSSYMIQWTIIVAGLGIAVPFGCLVGTLICNVSLLLLAVQNDLKYTILEEDDRKPLTAEVAEENYKKLKETVAYHQRVLEIAKNLNASYTLNIFLDVTFTALAVSVYGFKTIVSNDFLSKMNNISLGLSLSLIILLWAWPSQLLADASAEVATAAYSCLWYNRDMRFKKLIAIIIMRSQSPVYITGLGFSRVTLTTFATIMSTAYSYVSVFSRMNE